MGEFKQRNEELKRLNELTDQNMIQFLDLFEGHISPEFLEELDGETLNNYIAQKQKILEEKERQLTKMNNENTAKSAAYENKTRSGTYRKYNEKNK